MKQHPAQLLKHLGELLRATRKERSIPLRHLSRSSGVPVSTITRIERGEPNAPLTLIIRLAHALKLDQSDITKRLGLDIVRPYLPIGLRLPYEVQKGILSPGILDIENYLLERRAVLSKKGVPKLPGLEEQDILLLATLDHPIIEVPGSASTVIWKAVEDGLAVTYEDANLFVADIRRTHGLSLQAFGKEVGLVRSFLFRLEQQQVENIRLMDILQIETRFAQDGKIFTTYWAGGMFELWSQRKRVFAARSSLENLSNEEANVAKAYLRLIRIKRIIEHLQENDPSRPWTSVAPKYMILSTEQKAPK